MNKSAKYELDLSIEKIPFVGKKRAEKLAQKNIYTISDLLYFLPRKHLDRSNILKIGEVRLGEEVTCLGEIKSVETKRIGALKITEAILFDSSGYLFLTWFGERKIEKTLRAGTRISVSGTVSSYRGRLQMENPEFEIIEDENTIELLNTGKIVPVYPGINGISQRFLRKLIKEVLEKTYITENLPAEIVINENLLPRASALYEIHFPQNNNLLNKALYRLRFEELFLLQTALAHLKSIYSSPEMGIAHKGDERLVNEFLKKLNIELTGSQKNAIDEIIEDLKKKKPMNRLLQGEVGSGKTIVAIAAALYVSSAGHQVAFMAPTEILSQQQFYKYGEHLNSMGFQCEIFTSSVKGQKRKKILEEVREGKVKILFGTHALISDDVAFKSLGLVIIDEQHRFGTLQRLLLREKGKNPDLLIISATPIPRTLALTVFGDLDITTIYERPTGHDLKNQIDTFVLTPEKKEKAYEHLREEILKGNRAYVIVPLVEESPKLQAKTIDEAIKHLQKYVPVNEIGILHGRQSFVEKQTVLENFKKGKIKVLVATTVVEVGVDVPEATLMIIENAERFGLSQLHQLRGRVGRGKEKSYVYAISSFPTEESAKRLEVFTKVYDGFVLAEEDLKLRGEGDVFGYRQSGPSGLKFASLAKDLELLEKVRKESFSYYERFKNKSISVKMMLEEAGKRYGNLELALKA